MKISINTDTSKVVLEDDGHPPKEMPLHSREAFKAVSKVWVTQQWSQLNWQTFSWLGFQLCQFPEDVLRLQEVLFRLRPDVIVETGINRGGSAAFFASICQLLGRGRVYSVDISIPPDIRRGLEKAPFASLLHVIEGDSADPAVVESIRSSIRPGEKVFVFLDSDHSKGHVLRELEAYADLVSQDSYIVATDGVMESLTGTPYAEADWKDNNPAEAAREFVRRRSDFVICRPPCMYGDEHYIDELTYWPDAWLRRVSC
jgi:cephalosporin hydroxylase